MGSRLDRLRRSKLRVDTPALVETIASARAKIFKRGTPVKGEAIEAHLKPLSLVPVQVR